MCLISVVVFSVLDLREFEISFAIVPGNKFLGFDLVVEFSCVGDTGPELTVSPAGLDNYSIRDLEGLDLCHSAFVLEIIEIIRILRSGQLCRISYLKIIEYYVLAVCWAV